jgi:nitrogen fixation NifU-like protein
MADREQAGNVNTKHHMHSDEEQAESLFSPEVLKHAMHPQHRARLDQPDAYGALCGWCGEVMEIFLSLAGEEITKATFWADGCISTMACGDMITTMVEGMTLEQADQITPNELITALGGLPYASVHCSELSVGAVRQAITNRRQQMGCTGAAEP